MVSYYLSVTRPFALFAMLVCVGCGGRAAPSGSAAPQSINETLAQFMAAVKANNLTRMGELWGGERGPAASYMKREELQQRLASIQVYLNHAGYRVIEGPLPVSGNANAREFKIELQRATGCNVVFPIGLVRASNGSWLVNDVHLEAVGNPAARCQPRGGGGRGGGGGGGGGGTPH
jgi:hypothetical protein